MEPSGFRIEVQGAAGRVADRDGSCTEADALPWQALECEPSVLARDRANADGHRCASGDDRPGDVGRDLVQRESRYQVPELCGSTRIVYVPLAGGVFVDEAPFVPIGVGGTRVVPSGLVIESVIGSR